MSKKYNNDIYIRRDKSDRAISLMLDKPSVRIFNAHWVLETKDGRTYPYILQTMSRGQQRFYQVSKELFVDMIDKHTINNMILGRDKLQINILNIH